MRHSTAEHRFPDEGIETSSSSFSIECLYPAEHRFPDDGIETCCPLCLSLSFRLGVDRRALLLQVATSSPARSCAARGTRSELTGGVNSPLPRSRDPAGADPAGFGVGVAARFLHTAAWGPSAGSMRSCPRPLSREAARQAHRGAQRRQAQTRRHRRIRGPGSQRRRLEATARQAVALGVPCALRPTTIFPSGVRHGGSVHRSPSGHPSMSELRSAPEELKERVSPRRVASLRSRRARRAPARGGPRARAARMACSRASSTSSRRRADTSRAR